MKRFIRTDNDRIFKLEGLMFMGPVKEKYPIELTMDTKFDDDGRPLPLFYFDAVYDNFTISPEYEDIEEAYQDRKMIVNELNKE